ncbi:MAG: hypothetical protein ABSD59_09350 [Terracidiphilus sp.]|jgi:hypothetical protein
MMLTSCPHEKEVRQLIARGQWSAASPPALRAHVTGCRTCGDLVLVSEAFQQARVESAAAARPVPPALLLWRAQLRRRNAAMERITRPLLGAQIFACAVVVFAALGFAGFEARSGVDWFTWNFWRDWFVELPQAAASQWASLSAGPLTGSAWSWLVLGSALATLLLLGGAAVYFATDKQ